ncbi:MAG: hypothetical protein J6C05_09435 [Prevotella sp.]|nr:hypothetical protein [Prevotella sp.]
MAKKQNYLEKICSGLYNSGHHNKPNDKEFRDANLYSTILGMYRNLGGKLHEIPLNIGKYDIDLENVIIEFDEENHFNRYRLETFNSPIYKDWKNFNVTNYQQYCTKYENECRTYGKFWNTDSSDKQYGMSSPKGVLNNIGSSRWKQRAFYDFVKDVYSIVINTPIIRISIYDIYHEQTILSLIQQKREIELTQYVENRVNGLK